MAVNRIDAQIESTGDFADRWTPSQRQAMDSFACFLDSDLLRATFVLRGAAGTGKSTLTGEMVRTSIGRGWNIVLLAPTGRAARVLEDRTKHKTSTIHSAIYNLHDVVEQVDESEQPVFRFQLRASEHPVNTVYFVDEASMVGDFEAVDTNLRFGTGRLLLDLVTYVFWAHPDPRRKLVLVGDHCQLPPIHAEESPALNAQYLSHEHRLTVDECTLREIVRQSPDSALVAAAGRLREAIEGGRFHALRWVAGTDLRIHHDAPSFSKEVSQRFSQGTAPHVICYKNTTVRDWNELIRRTILHRGEDPEPGDRLVILKNHHLSQLRNGDFVELVAIGSRRQRVVRGIALSYREATVHFIAASGLQKWTGLLLENVLLSRERTLSDQEEQARWILFKMDHPGFRPGTAEFKEALLNDPYWNCLIARYGYATTCHKAQGGEWDEVFVDCDFGANRGLQNPATFRWLYTATTRARKSLQMLNPPTWSAVDVLAAPPSVPLAGSNTALEVEDAIESAVRAAAASAGLAPPQFTRLQFMIRAEWADKPIPLKADVRYKGDGSISGLAWSKTSPSGPSFSVQELESRRWAEQPITPTDACPDSVRESLDRLMLTAHEHDLGVNWILQQFAVVIVAFDNRTPSAGIAKVRASYDAVGRFTSKQIMSGDQFLIDRLNHLLTTLG